MTIPLIAVAVLAIFLVAYTVLRKKGSSSAFDLIAGDLNGKRIDSPRALYAVPHAKTWVRFSWVDGVQIEQHSYLMAAYLRKSVSAQDQGGTVLPTVSVALKRGVTRPVAWTFGPTSLNGTIKTSPGQRHLYGEGEGRRVTRWFVWSTSEADLWLSELPEKESEARLRELNPGFELLPGEHPVLTVSLGVDVTLLTPEDWMLVLNYADDVAHRWDKGRTVYPTQFARNALPDLWEPLQNTYEVELNGSFKLNEETN